MDFYHANYPEGVQHKVYELQTLERNSRFILARSMSHKPARLLLIYAVTAAWLAQHFDIRIAETVEAQTWLAENA